MHSPTPHVRTPARHKAVAGAAALTLLLAGCGTAQAPALTAEPTPETPYGHVHGIHADPATGKVLVASHHGLFDAGSGVPKQVGPTIDLMGSTTGKDGTLYASGHPGPGTDLPNPVGLIRSPDGGRTWETLSLSGESDFHAMTATGDRLLGFDGQLRTTTDGDTWTVLEAGFLPYALAGSPKGTAVLATTEQGVWRSADSGKSWSAPAGGPVLQTATFADRDTAVGITPDGTVYTSPDAGKRWEAVGSAEVRPAAVDAGYAKDGALNIWVADDDGIHLSTDGGTTFIPLDL